jgi:hypothetical protein
VRQLYLQQGAGAADVFRFRGKDVERGGLVLVVVAMIVAAASENKKPAEAGLGSQN